MVAFQSFLPDHGDPYMPFPANTPTVDDLPGLGLQDIAQLPVELLAVLQREIDERMARTKAAKARLDAGETDFDKLAAERGLTPAQANDPASLAGKLLRIEQPTTVNQAPTTTALSGLGPGGGMCIDPADQSLYVTDRTPTADRLQRITKDSQVSTVWTWPDRPGVAGCAALDGTVLVNLVNTKQTVAVRMAPETGAVTGDPEVVRQDQHGHAWALQVSPDGNVWGATVNKTTGDAMNLDDVVFPLFPQGGGFPRTNADNT